MLDWMLVDTPAWWPQRCVFPDCGTPQKGPFLDTHTELVVLGREYRVYVCQACALKALRGFNLEAAKDVDEREKSNEAEAELRKTVAALTRDKGGLEEQVAGLSRRVTELDGQLADARAWNERLKVQIKHAAEESLAVVGGE